MIFAELHGKLGVGYSRAHERGEDLLTSTVFGLLRYIPLDQGFRRVLDRVRPWPPEEKGAQDWLELGSVVRVTVDFWPYWRGYGEPDVLLKLYDAAESITAGVVVEAKLHAQKSGRARTNDENLADEDNHDPDQLVRYWQGLQKRFCGKASTWVIYLTKHGAPPAGELDDSVRRALGIRLAWLSWRDIWAVAEKLRATSLPAADLAGSQGSKAV